MANNTADLGWVDCHALRRDEEERGDERFDPSGLSRYSSGGAREWRSRLKLIEPDGTVIELGDDAAEAARLAAAEEQAQEQAEQEAARKAAEEARRIAKEKAEAEAKAKREAEEKARREAEAKAKAEAEEKARLEAEAKAKKEAEEKAKREAEEKAKREAEEKARLEAEAKAKKEAEEKARREAEAKAKKEAEEKAKREAEAKAKAEAEEKARLEAEAKAKKEAEEKARKEAEAKSRAEAKAKREAEALAKKEAAAKARAEAKAAREAEKKAEAERKAKEAAEAKAKKEAEEKAKREAEAKAKAEAEEKARLEAEAKAKKEAEEKAKAEAAAAKAREEEEARAKAEAEKAKKEEAAKAAKAQKAKSKAEAPAKEAAKDDAAEADDADSKPKPKPDLTIDLGKAYRRLIPNTGPISLAQYMGESNARYYASRDPLGDEGDFITAPEISQMFGELIGLWFADLWVKMGQSKRIHFVELGPGRGTLMTDAMRTASRYDFDPTIHFVEGSPALREIQKEKFPKAIHHEDLSTLPEDRPLLIIANEFFDALPIKQLIRSAQGWHERMVGLEGDNLAFVAGKEPMDSLVPPSWKNASQGTMIETSPAANALMAEISQRLTNQGGAALIIDYGPLEARSGSTLQALKDHNHVDPLSHPGEADLTAHVDFERLGQIAEENGAEVMGLQMQGEWLHQMGVETRHEALKRKDPGQVEVLERQYNRLTADDQMGTLFKVLGVCGRRWPIGFGFD